MKIAYYKLLAWALAAFGLGCSPGTNPFMSPEYGVPVVEYGPVPEYGIPQARYVLSGQVLQSDSPHAPIEAILIETPLAATRTDSLGRWTLDYHGFGLGIPGYPPCTLYVTDTDSTENGGAFTAQAIELALEQTAPASGYFDLGTFEQDSITVLLLDAGVGKIGE